MNATDFSPHPLANLFPMLVTEQLEELANDIKKNGLVEPIVLHEAKILDGRNRYQACEIAGVLPRFVEWKGEGGSPLHYVLSQNLHRRHLTTAQRAAIAAEVLPMFQEEARKRQGQRTDLQPSGQKTTTFGKARDEAAAMMNVSPASVERAKRVKETDPEEFERLKNGRARSINSALKNAGLTDTSAGRDKVGESAAVNLSTKRHREIAAANKRRVETALSNIAGACQGIEEINIEKAVAVMTTEEVAMWAKIAGDSARALRSLQQTLKRS